MRGKKWRAYYTLSRTPDHKLGMLFHLVHCWIISLLQLIIFIFFFDSCIIPGREAGQSGGSRCKGNSHVLWNHQPLPPPFVHIPCDPKIFWEFWFIYFGSAINLEILLDWLLHKYTNCFYSLFLLSHYIYIFHQWIFPSRQNVIF